MYSGFLKEHNTFAYIQYANNTPGHILRCFTRTVYRLHKRQLISSPSHDFDIIKSIDSNVLLIVLIGYHHPIQKLTHNSLNVQVTEALFVA